MIILTPKSNHCETNQTWSVSMRRTCYSGWIKKVKFLLETRCKAKHCTMKDLPRWPKNWLPSSILCRAVLSSACQQCCWSCHVAHVELHKDVILSLCNWETPSSASQARRLPQFGLWCGTCSESAEQSWGEKAKSLGFLKGPASVKWLLHISAAFYSYLFDVLASLSVGIVPRQAN